MVSGVFRLKSVKKEKRKTKKIGKVTFYIKDGINFLKT